jgi:putative sigma-54 modulation protein
MHMQVQIHSVHFDADQRLIAFVENKLSKLNTFHDHIISCEVFLRVEKNDARENKLSEVKIHAPGVDFFAKRRASSFEASVDEAVEAIRRQILKQKKVRAAVA